MSACNYSEKRDLNKVPIFKRKRPLLECLDIELTERCNNNCIHCCINLPQGDREALGRELSTDEWKDILDQAADSGVLTVRFTGGEPLLRDDFTELYLHARHLGIRVLLFTHARLITPEIAELFSRVPPLEKIEVTVYGMCPETYEAVSRVTGSFNEFRQGVQLLWEWKIPFVVKGALLPQNEVDRERFEAWAGTIPWMESPPAYSMFFDLRGRRDSLHKNQRISRLRITPKEGLAVLSRDENRYRQGMRQFCSQFLPPSGPQLFSCGAGDHACIDAYGKVQPCLLLRHPEVCCNIRKSSLKEAITDMIPRLRKMAANNPDYLMRCARCFIKGICEQCPAKSWSEHGTLDTPVEYLCDLAHAQARYLGLLEPGESAWEVTNGDERMRRFIHGLK